MKTKNVMIFLILILIVILLIYNPFKSKTSKEGEHDTFAQCLTDAGVKMYGTDWCSHCQNQKKLFGKSFDIIDYINCDKNKETCLIEGIEGYPTWKLNNESYTGEQSFEALARISGCEL